MKQIEFKSLKVYYEFEEADLKNNTVRNTSDWTERRWQEYDKAEYVHIHLNDGSASYPGSKSFIRRIKHKCRYGNLVIITWFPEKEYKVKYQ